MPNLKGLTPAKNKRRQALDNLDSIMGTGARTKKESTPAKPKTAPKIKAETKTKKTEAKTSTVRAAAPAPIQSGQMYGDIFEKVGSTTRKRYEEGRPPRGHREFFSEIKSALAGADEGPVVLAPILDRLEIGRSVSATILSCLEHYGYLTLQKDLSSRGHKGLIIRICAEIDDFPPVVGLRLEDE